MNKHTHTNTTQDPQLTHAHLQIGDYDVDMGSWLGKGAFSEVRIAYRAGDSPAASSSGSSVSRRQQVAVKIVDRYGKRNEDKGEEEEDDEDGEEDEEEGEKDNPAVICPLSSSKPSAKLAADANELLNTEVALMRELRHKNIVQLYDVVEVDTRVFLFMELARDGGAVSLKSERGSKKKTGAVLRSLPRLSFLFSSQTSIRI